MRHYYLMLGALAIVSRLALLPVLPHPRPTVHDEFSYLLQAKTFAEGRLSTNQHPKWQFFETIHVLSHPKFMSKFPPGQAAFLALGILLGHPHFGVMISFGLFVASVAWMLRAVVSDKWALFGGIWALLVFNIRLYWLESYWGGFVAAIGGNLVIGSFLYFYFDRRRSAKWWFAIGALLLSLTRPFEGLALIVATFAVFFTWQRFFEKERLRKNFISWVKPVALGATLVTLSVGTYNWQTLGSPLRSPYVEHEKQYGVAPPLWVLPIRTDQHFTDPTIAAFHKGWEVQEYRTTRESAPLALLVPLRMAEIVRVTALTMFGIYKSPLAIIYAITLLIMLSCPRDPQVRILFIIFGLTILPMSLEVWTFPHYLAPAMGLVVTIAVRSLSSCYDLSRATGEKPWFVGLAIGLALSGPTIDSVGYAVRANKDGVAWNLPDPTPVKYSLRPQEVIEEKLRRAGGQHVVFVRYSPSHNVHDEWVYNSPDIDAQPVIWARDRGKANQELMDYYRGRTFWVVDPDAPENQLQRLMDHNRMPAERATAQHLESQ